jgi:hypothetical protein
VISSRYIPKYGSNIRENLVSGFNLHYFPLNLVQAFIRAQTFQADIAVKAGLRHPVIKRCYRSYKVGGISMARRVDWKSFLERISITRQLKPQEREQLIALVEAQLSSNFKDLRSVNQIVQKFIASRSQALPVPGTQRPQQAWSPAPPEAQAGP